MLLFVFDLDDTLYPESSFVRSGFRSVSRKINTLYGIDGFYEIANNLYEEGIRGKIFNLALLELGLEEDQDLIQQLVKVYRTHEPSLQLHEDAQWLIDNLYGKPCGIITDGYLEVQQRKVRALNLEKCFNTIIYSDSFGKQNWKPSPVPYQEMMRLNALPGKSCIYVADNPTKDFVTAKRLGWLTIQIMRPDGEYANVSVDKPFQADILIDSLYEVPNLLEIS